MTATTTQIVAMLFPLLGVVIAALVALTVRKPRNKTTAIKARSSTKEAVEELDQADRLIRSARRKLHPTS
jgi:phosphate/sulfate permease